MILNWHIIEDRKSALGKMVRYIGLLIGLANSKTLESFNH